MKAAEVQNDNAQGARRRLVSTCIAKNGRRIFVKLTIALWRDETNMPIGTAAILEVLQRALKKAENWNAGSPGSMTA